MKQLFILLFLMSLLGACNTDNAPSTNDQLISLSADDLASRIKYHPDDPFLKTLKESEFFELSGLKDEIIETANGTVLSIPKAAFKDSEGNIVEEAIRIEISDIAALEEQIQSNITDKEGKAMSHAATLYINATKDGKALYLNPDSPIYVETPINTAPKDLMLFQGIRNEQGDMQWLHPTKPKQYLVPVDLEALDFLPDGFAEAVEKGMPYPNYQQATKKLIDSLYYSFAADMTGHNTTTITTEGIESSDYLNHLKNTKHFNQQSETSDSTDQVDDIPAPCTFIQPSVIKVIKGKKFANTFIATKAFETRMRHLHRSGRQDALEIYTKNLDSDVSVCDKAVAELLGRHHTSQVRFLAFAQENLSNLKDLPPAVKNMGAYYSRQLITTQKELANTRQNYLKALKKKDEAIQKVRVAYEKILDKRLKYRVEKFGFKLVKQGWITLAKALEPLPKFTLDINVKDGQNYDRVYVYTIDKRINSIFAFRSIDQQRFHQVYHRNPHLLYLPNQMAKALAVAYKGDQVFYTIEDFQVTKSVKMTLKPQPSNMKEFKKVLQKLESGHKRFNKVWVDLDFQEKFYEEQVRQKNLKKEWEFINSLRPFALPCPQLQYILPSSK